MDPNNIYKLRVHRRDMSKFPFDLVYLIHEDQRELLPKMFPYALCLPMTRSLEFLFNPNIIHTGVDLQHVGTRTTTYQSGPLPFDNLTSWFLVVPILSVRRSSKMAPLNYRAYAVSKCEKYQRPDDRVPVYLTAPRHYAPGRATTDERIVGANKFRGIFTERTTLITPHRIYQPICLSCPRYMLHLQGKCALGDRMCLENIVLKKGRVPQGDNSDELVPKDNTEHHPD